MKNNDINQDVTEHLKYIIVKIDYNCKLIMPIEDGLNFIKFWACATEIKEKYNEPSIVRNPDKDFSVRFITEAQFKEIKMAAVIGAA